jgi:hypothetical protein
LDWVELSLHEIALLLVARVKKLQIPRCPTSREVRNPELQKRFVRSHGTIRAENSFEEKLTVSFSVQSTVVQRLVREKFLPERH